MPASASPAASRRPSGSIRLAFILALAGSGAGASTIESAASTDLAALIECRRDVAAYAHTIVPVLNDPAAATALGWQALPRSNPFMTEFRLPAPIAVFGSSSDHIMVSGATIMALLDGPTPRILAQRLNLQIAMDTADKFMAGRELASRDIVTPATGEKMIESVILSVSDVHSHPGKTLAGCTYDLDEP